MTAGMAYRGGAAAGGGAATALLALTQGAVVRVEADHCECAHLAGPVPAVRAVDHDRRRTRRHLAVQGRQ